eukprot:scaffold77641_cov36-Prasinocladus_malaysianus.AAC.1
MDVDAQQLLTKVSTSSSRATFAKSYVEFMMSRYSLSAVDALTSLDWEYSVTGGLYFGTYNALRIIIPHVDGDAIPPWVGLISTTWPHRMGSTAC